MVLSSLLAFGTVLSPASAQALQRPDHVTVVSDDPVNNTPDVLDGHVNQVAQIGDLVVVTGKFTSVQPRGSIAVTRNNIFAFSASTGQLSTAFAPTIDREVFDIEVAADQQSVWIVGDFLNVNAAPRTGRIAQLDVDTGAVISTFKSPAPSQRITELVYANGALYVGGVFQRMSSVQQELVAALNPTTGANLGTIGADFDGLWNGGYLSVRDMDITPDGTKMVVTGNFRTINGQVRNQAAMFNLNPGSTATLSSWATSRYSNTCSSGPDTYMRDVAISPDGAYFVIVTTGAYAGGPGANTLCDTAARWETQATGSGQEPTWVNYTGGDTLTRAIVTTAAIYVGGHQRWMNNPYASDAKGPGAVDRSGLVALDPRNGLPLSWNPGRQRGYGVYGFTLTDAALWVGHDTRLVAGELRARLTSFPLAGGTTNPAEVVGTLPGMVYELGASIGADDVIRRSFDGVTAGAPASIANGGQSWRNSRGSFVVDGVLYTAWSNGTLTTRAFSGGAFGPASTVNLNNLTAFSNEMSSMTSMFYDKATGRLYFTLGNDSNLYYRYFTPESQIVGGIRYVAQGSTADLNWKLVTGGFLAGGKLYFATTDGNLSSMRWSSNTVVNGTKSTTSGPAIDGQNWAARGLVLVNN